MKKKRLRYIGIGFLISAILTGLHATFVQGNAPFGVTISGALGGQNEEAESQLAEQSAELDTLRAERDSLLEERQVLVESLNKMSEEESDSSSDSQSRRSTSRDTDEAEDETADTMDDADTGDTTETEDAVSGEFVVESGATSADIANELESQGFISSAAEFEELIDTWGLHEAIQSGSYELNSDMSIHDIASILTNGAYYYY